MDRSAVFLVVLFSCFAADCSEGNRKLALSVSDNGDSSWNVHGFGDDVAERGWNFCLKGVKDSVEHGEGICSFLCQSSPDGLKLCSGKGTLRNAVADLPPKKKQVILDGLMGENLPTSRDEQETWLSRFEKLIETSASTPRRYLRAQHKWSKLRAVRADASSTSNPSQNSNIHLYFMASLAMCLVLTIALIALSILICLMRKQMELKDGVRGEKPRLNSSSSDISSASGKPQVNGNSKSEDVEPASDTASSMDANCDSLQSEPQKTQVKVESDGKTETLPLPPGKTETLPLPPGRTETLPPGRTETLPLPPGRTETLPLGRTEMLRPPPGRTEMLRRPPGRTETWRRPPGRTESLRRPPGRMEALPLPPGRTETLPLPPGRTETLPLLPGRNETLPLPPGTTEVLPLPPGKTEEVAGKTETLPLPPGKTASPPPTPPPGKNAPPPPPPPKGSSAAAPAPPPPPKAGGSPPNAPPPLRTPGHRRRTSSSESPNEGRPPKTKLKPLFWDKVLASPDQSMIWDNIRTGSFQFNEEMMETLFGFATADKNKTEKKKESSAFDNTPHFISIIDAKKAQNLSILLKALNVTTEEVCDALKEGNELQPELVQTLLKMAPTTEEELKLRLYSGDLSQLGPAERFLKALVDIPFSYKRLESLLFMSTFQEDFSSVKESLSTLEVACNELTSSRLFLKLLEAVLKTGNRMNDGTYRGGATAFKLDTLLKLSDVKGTDGKTTLLHFVILEIIRSEGIRAARRLRESQSSSSAMTEDSNEDSSHDTEEYHRSLGLQLVSGVSNELENVKKAAVIDAQALNQTVVKLGHSLTKMKEFLNTDLQSLEGADSFRDALANNVNKLESDVRWLIAEEKRITDLVKSTRDIFHGKSSKDEGSHLFVVVRDFLLMSDKACKDVKSLSMMPAKTPKKGDSPSSASANALQSAPRESTVAMRKRLFPSMRERQKGDSSDDES